MDQEHDNFAIVFAAMGVSTFRLFCYIVYSNVSQTFSLMELLEGLCIFIKINDILKEWRG